MIASCFVAITLPGGFFFNAEAFTLKFSTQNRMILQ
jgi:hypothetical protein